MPSTGDRYTFGDSDLAARRLALVAEIFRGTTERFLRDNGSAAPDLAVDLGCGPGYTTELITTTARPRRIIAVDSSPGYVASASRRLGDAAEVIRGDVLALPERVRDADLVFARLLLTHLADPVAAVERWLGRLSARGVLMLEEVESITTDEPAFRVYLELQRRMLAANRHTLEIGPIIDAAIRARATIHHSELAATTPPTTAVARMFSMNFAVWRHEPAVASLATTAQLDKIAAGLEDLIAASRAAPIIWRLRQVVLSPQTWWACVPGRAARLRFRDVSDGDREPESGEGRDLDDYRSYVGPGDQYDVIGAGQFALLYALGLRAHHRLLDIGCGSLRAGRMLIAYLDAERYTGVDPNGWLVEQAIDSQLGRDILAIKQPRFDARADLMLSELGQFDFVLAHGIATNTGPAMMRMLLRAIRAALTPDGLAAATFIHPGSGDREAVDVELDDPDAPDWRYPGCYSYAPAAIADAVTAADLSGRPIDWYHPRHRWWLLTRAEDRLPPASFLSALNGATLADGFAASRPPDPTPGARELVARRPAA